LLTCAYTLACAWAGACALTQENKHLPLLERYTPAGRKAAAAAAVAAAAAAKDAWTAGPEAQAYWTFADNVTQCESCKHFCINAVQGIERSILGQYTSQGVTSWGDLKMTLNLAGILSEDLCVAEHYDKVTMVAAVAVAAVAVAAVAVAAVAVVVAAKQYSSCSSSCSGSSKWQ